MKILFFLGNKLLSEGLKKLLVDSGCKYNIDILTPKEIHSNLRLEPEVILTDYFSLSKLPKDCFESHKIVVIDSGLEKETIVSLFITDKIRGIISTDSNVDMLLKAIKVINNGEVWIDNPTMKSLLDRSITRKIKYATKLTERETALLKLVKEGYRNKEIANALSISEQTVKSHLNRIFRKMNVSGRTELVAKFANFTNI